MKLAKIEIKIIARTPLVLDFYPIKLTLRS